jgi:predicted  nucleic acid-binding Zn-ribbon protein
MADHDPSDLAVMTFEMLKRIQQQLDRMENDIHDLKVRMTNVDMHMGTMMSSIGGLNQRMDRMDDRVARIEPRLDIADTAAE